MLGVFFLNGLNPKVSLLLVGIAKSLVDDGPFAGWVDK